MTKRHRFPNSVLVQQAIDSVWKVIAHTDAVRSEKQTIGLIARYVRREAAGGENNPVQLVHKSLLEFRRRQRRIRVAKFKEINSI